jgi:hypothetical protein
MVWLDRIAPSDLGPSSYWKLRSHNIYIYYIYIYFIYIYIYKKKKVLFMPPVTSKVGWLLTSTPEDENFIRL